MANLNIPFLLPQGNQFNFKLCASGSKIKHSFMGAEIMLGGSASASSDQSEQVKEIKKNIMVLAERGTGNMIMCEHHMILSDKEDQPSRTAAKFVVSIKPKLYCVPKIYPSADQLDQMGRPRGIQCQFVDYCYVKSPADHILSTSQYLLVTIHQNLFDVEEHSFESTGDTTPQGGYMRLWNTNDGRCIMISPLEMFNEFRKPYKIILLSDYIQHNSVPSFGVKGSKAGGQQSPGVLNGLVLCVCQSEEILIINVYTMTVVYKFDEDFQDLQYCNFDVIDGVLMITIMDNKQKVHVIRTSKFSASRAAADKMQKIRQWRQVSKLMLSHCDSQQIQPMFLHQVHELFQFDVLFQGQASRKDTVINRGVHRQVLAVSLLVGNAILIVQQDKIEVIQQHVGFFGSEGGGEGEGGDDQVARARTLLQYEREKQTGFMARGMEQKEENWFLFAQILDINESKILLCIDNVLSLLIYDIQTLVTGKRDSVLSKEVDPTKDNVDDKQKGLLFKGDLIEQVAKFNLFERKRVRYPGKQEEAEIVQEIVKQKGMADEAQFSYAEGLNLLYMFVEIEKKYKLVSWSMQGLLDKLFEAGKWQDLKLPVCISPITFSGTEEVQPPRNTLINLHPFIQKHYFSRYQHSFFYLDERITDQTFYVASDYPAIVLGTNYGRIFIVQLFQDIECRGYPILALDCHQSSPITCLYMSYSTARRSKQMQPEFKGSDQQLAQIIAADSGGHLIACSKNGTISLTNMNAGEIISVLDNFSIRRNDNVKKRMDMFMREREQNQRRGRRQSFSGHYQMQKYFNLVKINPMKVFPQCSYGQVSRVLEVQILQQNQQDRMRYLQLGSTTLPSAAEIGERRQKEMTQEQHTDSSQANSNHNSPMQKKEEQQSDQKGGGETQFYRHGLQTYEHHLRQINELTVGNSVSPQDIQQLNSPQPLLNELSPYKSSYACVDEQQYAVYLLSIQKGNQCDMVSIQGLDSRPIGVYDDVLQNFVHVITTAHLNVYTFNKRSKRIVRKSNYTFAQGLLQINQTIYAMVEKQQYFKLANLQHSEKIIGLSGQQYDQYSYKQQFKEGAVLRGMVRSTQMGSTSQQSNSHHSVFDFLGLSLSLPLYYHPHHLLSQKFTKSVKDLLPYRDKIRACYQVGVSSQGQQSIDRAARDSTMVKQVMRRIIQSDFIWNDRYKSDFNQDYYQAQGAVTPLLTGLAQQETAEDGADTTATDHQHTRQQMIIINTKDMINIFKGRMKILTESIRRQNQSELSSQTSKPNGGGGGGHHHHHHHHHHQKGQAGDDQKEKVNIPAEYFQKSKWPTKLLALVHPFSLDDNLDENLELFFGLSIPFLDCKIGVQGIDEAFSFVLAQDLRDKEPQYKTPTSYDDPLSEIDSISEPQAVQLLSLSIIERKLRQQRGQVSGGFDAAGGSALDSIPRQLTFVNSDFWKISPYLTTIMASFFQSTLVSIIEFAQQDITTLMHDWLNAVQYITSPLTMMQGDSQQVDLGDVALAFDDQGGSDSILTLLKLSLENKVQPLSVTVLSQLMLRKDHSISSCARDILMKPLLLSSTGNGTQVENVKHEINEWQDLIMDTYLKLKEDSSSKSMGDLSLNKLPTMNSQQARKNTSAHLLETQHHQNTMQNPQGMQSLADARNNSSRGKTQKHSSQSSKRDSSMDINNRSGASRDGRDQMVSPHTGGAAGHPGMQQLSGLAIHQQISGGSGGGDKSINHFFGEFEIRGLVNLSYYALYTQKGADELKIQSDVQNRLCKCTVILTREIMIKFTTNCNEYQNMLTILMQLLQTQMRAQVPTFKTKVIKEDVIKILLMIYDFHKKLLKDERFLTRVVAQNFHLTLPKNAELYLKLTAAKTLLEIGTFFTEDFLMLINEQATTLKDGPEYQRSVLDVLRYYINGQNDGRLEPYLIQIVQTLLKCLDPNDEQLRKNSTQIISVILSTMVKNFPMIAFHHESQRLAVGTTTGAIAIYDVRTSQRQRILEGHTAPILSVEFDSRGNSLASYSGQDLSIRQWKVGNSSFLSGLMGSSGKNSKCIQLKRLAAPSSGPLQADNSNRINKTAAGNFDLVNADLSDNSASMQSTSVNTQKSKITFVNNDKNIVLTRENGSQEQF